MRQANAGADITAGGDYGAARVNAYKQTPAYHNAIAAVFRAQAPDRQALILQNLVRQQRNDPYAKHDQTAIAIGNAYNDLSYGVKAEIAKFAKLPSGPNVVDAATKGLGKALDTGLKGIGTGLSAIEGLHAGPNNGQFGSTAGVNAGPIGHALLHLPINTSRALVDNPVHFAGATAKGFADSVVGATAGAVQLPYTAITQGPGAAVSGLVKGLSADLNRRYGGTDQQIVDRMKKEGAGPEIFDLAAAAGGLDATAGRAISTIAKTGERLSGHPNILTRERPQLQISGNKPRPQTLAPTAGRALAQRAEDRLRIARNNKRPGEIMPRALQNSRPQTIAPIFQHHAMNVYHSGVEQLYRRQMAEHQLAEVRPRSGSALSGMGKLSSIQQAAIYHTIQGARVDTAKHFVADLQQRRAEIVAERAAHPGKGNHIPAQWKGQVDELALIDKLLPKADKIVGSKMLAYQKAEGLRGQRMDTHSTLHPTTAEARRLRPLEGRINSLQDKQITHPDVAAVEAQAAAEAAAKRAAARNSTAPVRSAGGSPVMARRGLGDALVAARTAAKAEKLASLSRPEQLAAYIKEMRAGMDKHGLPEPGFFPHGEHPKVNYGAYASGSGGRANAGYKHSDWNLYRQGVVHHSPQAYLDGLARTIKMPYQWRMTTHQYEAGAHTPPTRAEIKAAGIKGNKGPQQLTGHELQQVRAFQGFNMKHISFLRPGRLAERVLNDQGMLTKAHQGNLIGDRGTEQANAHIHELLQQHDIVRHGDSYHANDVHLSTTGWQTVPRTVHEQIADGLKGNSKASRIAGKIQGTQAGLILAQNPHFVVMNTLAHAFPTLAGTKGRALTSMAAAPPWFHGLSPEAQRIVDSSAGGRAGHYAQTAKLGSTAPNQIAQGFRELSQKGVVQKFQTVNPLHWLDHAETLQSNYFRRVVMHSEIKQQAFRDIGAELGHAARVWAQVQHVFDHKNVNDRMNAIVHNMTKMEELGRTAVNILGDYGRFTKFERTWLNNKGVLFYSFLRHVTRTLLYVLPVRHPLAFGLMGELGNLHVEEVKKLLGGQDLPWAYGRIFFGGTGGKQLKSIDLTSTSPMSSQLVDVLSGGIKQSPRLLSPVIQNLLDVAYGKSPQGTPIKQNAWSMINNVLSLSYPYRQAAVLHHGLKPQQSDSVPFLHDRPQTFKTAKAQQYADQKTAARGPLKDYQLGSLLGLYPKPDDSQVIAAHRASLAAAHARNVAKKSGGSGGYLMGGGGSSGGGGYLMSPAGSGGGSGGGGYLMP